MYFNAIKNLLEEKGLDDVFTKTDVDAVICVRSAISGTDYTNEEFELLCDTVIDVSQHMTLCCTQEIADVVCDLYKDLGFGFRNEKCEEEFDGVTLTRTLSIDQLEDLDYRTRDMIVLIVNESINNNL